MPIHSIVDLITNSSTTVFIVAKESTIKAVKELIDQLLELGGCRQRADDLFSFKLECDRYQDWLSEETMANTDYDESLGWKERNVICKEALAQVLASEDKPDWFKTEEEWLTSNEECDEYHDISLIVTAKEGEAELAAKVARLLSNLTGMFEMEAEYRG